MKENEIKKIMLKKNKEFKKVFNEHQNCEKELEKFNKKSYLTEKERVQEKNLKKKKLMLKDKMYFLMAQFKKEGQ